jgi:hypothetical protein
MYRCVMIAATGLKKLNFTEKARQGRNENKGYY